MRQRTTIFKLQKISKTLVGAIPYNEQEYYCNHHAMILDYILIEENEEPTLIFKNTNIDDAQVKIPISEGPDEFFYLFVDLQVGSFSTGAKPSKVAKTDILAKIDRIFKTENIPPISDESFVRDGHTGYGSYYLLQSWNRENMESTAKLEIYKKLIEFDKQIFELGSLNDKWTEYAMDCYRWNLDESFLELFKGKIDFWFTDSDKNTIFRIGIFYNYHFMLLELFAQC